MFELNVCMKWQLYSDPSTVPAADRELFIATLNAFEKRIENGFKERQRTCGLIVSIENDH